MQRCPFPSCIPQGNPWVSWIKREFERGLFGVELGTWAIDENTIDFLWSRLCEIRPETVLEFGSGSSTIVFSEWMKENNPDGLVVSIDQNEWAAKQTLETLRRFGLENLAKILVFGQDANERFIIDHESIKVAFGHRKVDVLFSDGPAGREGCRDNTLPDSFPLLADSAHWFLHDALRDPELDILRSWSNNPGVEVNGIVPFGNGLAVGIYATQTE